MAGREVEPHRRVVFGATGGLVSDRQSGCLRRCDRGMGEKDDNHGNVASCGHMCPTMGQPAGMVTADDTVHASVAPASDLAAHVGHTIRVTGTLYSGAILVSQAEMNTNDTYTDVTLSRMM